MSSQAAASNPLLSFRLLSSLQSTFSSRIGLVTLTRPSNSTATTIEIPTPGFMTTTSRGTVPHLSRDHVKKTSSIDWVHVPFETFLEHSPPVPTLQPGSHPLHKFLGFLPAKHILSMSLRDPADGRDITPNAKDSVSALCVRGVKKVTPAAYNTYITWAQPDIIFALSDIPFTPAPHSEKRIIKSLERSLSWLATSLRLNPAQPSGNGPNIFVHMVGGASDVARDDFATGLLEPLDGANARDLKPLGLETLDDGISGYVFDLIPLQASIVGSSPSTEHADTSDQAVSLIQTSLTPLPPTKLRLSTSAISPHQILKLVQTGIDLFDSHFAQKAADWGIALDFKFPVTSPETPEREHENETKEIGHNLYEEKFAEQFTSLSSNFTSGAEQQDGTSARPICPCIGCSPVFSTSPILHSPLDAVSFSSNNVDSTPLYEPPVTRAYVHHLLHTHEMSAHAILAAHNISVLSAFFAGIRSVIQTTPQLFDEQVELFSKQYSHPDWAGGLFDRAKSQYQEVDWARGKGRLAREKASKDAVAAPIAVDWVASALSENDAIKRDVAVNVADEVLGA